MKNVNALLYASWFPLPGSARFLITTKATWFVTTYPKVHEESLIIVRTAGWLKFGVKRSAMLARFKAGMSTSPIAMTPAVADIVKSQKKV